MNRGVIFAALAYVFWGLLPIYWKWLQAVPALEILAHRIVWAALFTMLLSALLGGMATLRNAVRQPKILLAYGASTLLLAGNWFIYIWGVNAGHIVETSLGYFINPLVNVALGVLILRERLRPGQIVAVLTALVGVLFLTINYGSPPWIALTLAFSFGAYGLIRKTAPLESLAGLTLETGLIALPGLGYLLFLGSQGTSSFGSVDLLTSGLLAGAGVITAIPLLLFASGARRVTLSTLGVLQYVAPTLQFLIGVTIYGETLSQARLTGFMIVWAALAIYTFDSISAARRRISTPQPA